MNRVASIIAPITLGLTLSEGAQAQSETPPRPEQEITVYRDQVRAHIGRTINPSGLKLEGATTTISSHSHVGYRVGETGWSIGVNNTRMKGYSLPPWVKQGGVNYGVAFILKKDIF